MNNLLINHYPTFNFILKDIVAQADEIGGNILQFEGLGVTSGVVHGILKLSDQQNAKLIKDVSVNRKILVFFLCL